MASKFSLQLRIILCFMALVLGGSLVWAQTSSVPLVAPVANQPVKSQTIPTDAEKGSEIQTITVEGAERVEPKTIISYLLFKVGDPWSPRLVDDSIKALYASDLFSNVIISRDKDKKSVVVRVQENPTILRVAFEGNDRVENNILEAEVGIKARSLYSKDKVRTAVSRIVQLYQRKGRYAVIVEPKIIEHPENRIDLVFEITEGARSDVKKITFVGNKYFSDTELADKIITKEARWYRFFNPNDSYDTDRLNVDKDQLRLIYQNAGFADFKVLSAVAELEEDKSGFFITFTIDEGVRYKVGEVKVSTEIPDLDIKELRGLADIDKGDYYSAKRANDAILAMTDNLGKAGFAFVEIDPNLAKNPEQKTLDINFVVQNGKQVYVERINIKGNTRTVEKLIRRQILLAEGDGFNSAKIRQSRQNIQDLGYFKSVNVDNKPGTAADRSQLDISVEEQSTGEVQLGVGFSTTDGVLLQTGIRERNLLGEGRTLALDLQAAQKRQNGTLSFTEKYFMDKDLEAGFDIFSTRTNRKTLSGYSVLDTGMNLRTGFAYNDTTYQRYYYRLNNRKIYDVDTNASLAVKQQLGRQLTSAIGQTISYDARNSKIDPTDGFYYSLNTDLAGLGGDIGYWKIDNNLAYYNNIFDNLVAVVGAEVGTIHGAFGKKVQISDRFFLGGSNLRGFSDGGVGPVDSLGYSLGGKKYATQSTEARFPLGIFEEIGAKVHIFNDLGYLTDPEEKYDGIRNSKKIRAAAGTGLSFRTPIGPMVFSLAKAYSKENYDNTQLFRFDFRSRF